ncbi:MOSC domain-containing protein [Falsiroseomonas selenitidurans]|uniref:MOSC domain-containing protein n=1 Tax=Falsiroseomonas selenitidurans TaxID=2716335 RepID=A0ABX1DZH9_9PROT|nr:MOSC domain-containing protein [Falsiroseomonas selenitidurans]NKC29908.1 MOSC domain-containing protein [Falsiroseomonas selenitidurans]
MRIERICRYPVKGLSAEVLGAVRLTAGEGLPEDRRFAFAQGDSPFDPAAPAWLQKRHFACLMANAKVAAIRAAYDAPSQLLALQAPGQAPLQADLATEAGRSQAAAWMTEFLGEEARGALRFAMAPGHAFTDIAAKAVSLIGLASIQALEAKAGMALDPLRFRANILFSGAAPFAEFDWIGREILLGGARLRVFKRTQRCAATEVNPETAERDARPQRWLREHFGHADLGVYAEVLEGGLVATGDALAPVQPDLLG